MSKNENFCLFFFVLGVNKLMNEDKQIILWVINGFLVLWVFFSLGHNSEARLSRYNNFTISHEPGNRKLHRSSSPLDWVHAYAGKFPRHRSYHECLSRAHPSSACRYHISYRALKRRKSKYKRVSFSQNPQFWQYRLQWQYHCSMRI